MRVSLSLISARERFVYFSLVILKAISGLLDILGIALIGLVSGLAVSNFDPNSPPLKFAGIELPKVSTEMLLYLVIGVLVVFGVKAAVALILSRSISNFLARIDTEKSAEVAGYLFSGNLGNLQRFGKGEITWAVMGSIAASFSGMLLNLATIITEGFLLILITSTFFFIDPIATFFVLGYFALIIVTLQLIIGRALKQAGIDQAQGNIEGMSVLNDTIGAYREITVFDKQQFFIKKFHAARKRLSGSTATLNFYVGMPRYVVETALMLGVVIFVGFQFLTGQLATGFMAVGVFLAGGVRIMGSLLPLQNSATAAKNLVEQTVMAHNILTEAQAQDKAEREKPKKESTPTSEIRISGALDVLMDDVSFIYTGSSIPAVRNISLNIKGGQHVAFIGPSGAGKTTIVDLILGLFEPTSGYLRVGNEDTNHRALIKQGLVSYVPQRPGIVAGSIAENIALGIDPAEIDFDRVQSALKKAHLAEFVDSLPEGANTSVGTQADSLSGGQIQRLGLARALYVDPKLIVLDEATSALDAGSEAFISQSLKDLGDDVTVIVIAHRLSTVQHSDVVFVVEDGEITASGSFSHLRKTVPMVADYVKLMSFGDIVQDAE